MFHRILVPLDGSPSAERAIPIAARIARASHASLLFVRVVMPTVHYGLYPERHMLAYQEELQESDHAAALYALKEVMYREDIAGLDKTIEVFSGEPAEVRLRLLEQQSFDLLVLCRHGQRPDQPWLLGRTAQKVARHSPVPVLLVSDAHLAMVTTTEHRGIHALVGLDGSPAAEHMLVPAAHLVAALSAPASGTLHLLTVIRTTGRARDGRAGREKQLEQEARTYLGTITSHFEEHLAAQRLSIIPSVKAGDDVAHTLLAQTAHAEKSAQADREAQMDLVALATYGHGTLHRWIMGSTSERLLNSATCPLFLVRSALVQT